MRFIKHLLVIAVIFIIIFVSKDSSHDSHMTILYALAGINVVLICFNLAVRCSLAFKPYFLSPFNIFSAHFKKEFDVEIPADLAFDKIREVIDESGFKQITADKDRLEILAIARPGFRSWGENVYFTLTESGSHTRVRFDSAALFQLYTWGKNEDNYSAFFKKLDDSFTI